MGLMETCGWVLCGVGLANLGLTIIYGAAWALCRLTPLGDIVERYVDTLPGCEP